LPSPHNRSLSIGEAIQAKNQRNAAARSWLDALIDQVLGIDFTQPFQREGRPRAVAQQPLQALAVFRLDAHADIKRRRQPLSTAHPSARRVHSPSSSSSN
jgi:hypothetical protein